MIKITTIKTGRLRYALSPIVIRFVIILVIVIFIGTPVPSRPRWLAIRVGLSSTVQVDFFPAPYQITNIRDWLNTLPYWSCVLTVIV